MFIVNLSSLQSSSLMPLILHEIRREGLVFFVFFLNSKETNSIDFDHFNINV